MRDTSDIIHGLRDLYARVIHDLDIRRAMDQVRPVVEAFIGGDAPNPRRPLRVVAIGKAAVPMTRWVVDEYGSSNVKGVLASPVLPAARWKNVRAFAGGHPFPNHASLEAGRAVLELLAPTTDGDRTLFLISGGGSALLEAPLLPTITRDDLETVHRLLVTCGAGIVEMNTIRKHLSAVKGGRLAQAAWPSRQLTLYVSDVPPGHHDSVASGPTMPDATTWTEVRALVDRYELWPHLPASIRGLLSVHSSPETPNPEDTCFEGARWVCVLENASAIDAARGFAESQQWETVVDISVDDAHFADAAGHLLDRLRTLRDANPGHTVCVLSGGELSSPVRGEGTGGRNQAFALECARRIAGESIAVLSAGTDGIDGNSPAAGAIADGTTIARADAARMDARDYLERCDAYTFFRRLGDDLTCGPTHNNVRDIRALVAWS